MKSKNTYDFPVELQTIHAGKIEIPRRFAVIRTDTDTPLGIVSDKYALVPHAEVIDGFREATKGSKVSERITMQRSGAKMNYKLTFDDIRIKVDKGDEVAMQLLVENTYNGTQMLQVMFGAFRMVCSNGMVIGKKFVGLSQRHIGEGVGLKVEVIQEQIGMLKNQFEKTGPLMKEMNETNLVPSPAEFFDPKRLRIPNYLTEIATQQYEKKGETVWDAYNAITHAITHEMKKESPYMSMIYGKRAWEAAQLAMR